MPGNIRGDARQEIRQPGELVPRVVEPGNQERHDLEPEPHRVKTTNRLEDRLEPAPELPVVPIVEALQVDLVEIDPRAEVLQHLWSTVAVGNVPGSEACSLGFLEHRDRPFARDERFVVRAYQDAGPE